MPFAPLSTDTEKLRRGFVPLAEAESDRPQHGFTPIQTDDQPGIFAPALETVEDIGRVYPVAEAGANLLTQAVAVPVSGVIGLGAMATRALGITDAEPADVIHSVGSALTYQPQTEHGKHLTNTVMLPFEKLAEAGQLAGGKTLDATGSPAAATAVDAAINMLPLGFVPAVRGAKSIKGRRNEQATEAPPVQDVPVSSAEQHSGFVPLDPNTSPVANAGRGAIEAGREAPTPYRPQENAPAAQLEGTEHATAPQGVRSLEGNDPALYGAEPLGLETLRGQGSESLPGVDQQLRPVPVGHGASADTAALAGAAGRVGELRAGELLLDDTAATGTAARILPEGDYPWADHDSGGSGATTGAADAEYRLAPGEERVQPGAATGRETVPGIEVADVQRRDPAAAGMGETSRNIQTPAMETPSGRLVGGSSADGTQPTLFGRDITEYSSDELSHYRATLKSQTNRGKIEAELAHRAIEPTLFRAAKTLGKIRDSGVPLDDALVRIGIEPGKLTPETRAAIQHLQDNPESPEAVRQVSASLRAESRDSTAGAAKVQDMAVQNSWAPGANYAPLFNDTHAPASVAKTVADLPKPLRREKILGEFARDLGTTIYEGRVKGKNRLGFFRPKLQEVRIKRSSDLEVAAHEIGHLLDDRVPAISNAWRNDEALRNELKAISYDKDKISEGYAEGVRLFLTQPDVLQAKAPLVHKWLEDFTNTHKHGPALRKAQEGMTGWFGQDALNRARSKIGDHKPLSDYFDGVWDKFRQSTVDDLHGVMAMEKNLTGKLSPVGAYESARLSRASHSIADGSLRFGAPVKKADGSFTFKGKGLEEILKPVAEGLDDALLYFVGRSSAELMAQKREHLFTKGEIDSMLQLRTPERDVAFKEYQAWNKAVLDFAEAQGVINSEARRLWQRTQYLPFHRVGQGDGFKGKPGDWSGVKALTGGTSNIRDVLGNMVSNAAQLIDHAVKNEARQKIAALANETGGGKFMVKIDAETRPVKVDKRAALDGLLKAMGIDRHAPDLPKDLQKLIKELEAVMEKSPGMLEMFIGNQPPAGSNVVAVLKNGKPTWYEVGDPILYRALSALDRPNQHWIVKWLGLPKRIGQTTITLTPDFMVANVLRDTIMGSIMSRSGFRPVIDSLDGMRLRLTNDPLYKDYIANGGGLSSIYLDDTRFKAKLERFYSKQGIDYHTVLDAPDKLLNFVETLADAFEMSTRLGEYKRAIEKGENPRHAAYQGREVSTDFAMRGDSKALGFMYDTVMFLRPAVVSMDRLFRGLAHDPNKGAIAVKSGMLALASVGLYLLNRDDPRYQDLQDWDRDSHWHFFVGDQHFRYPKIWEIGALASVAERTAEKTIEADPMGLGADFVRIVKNVFSLNMMPQAIAPLYEQATNRNSFTKAPVETPGMENMQPFLRAKPNTSETLKAAGMATRDLPESMQVNPARAEALLRGYFNTWALYGLALSDKAFFGDKLPEGRADQLPVVRRFYSQEPPQHTKYETMFYDMLGEAKRLHGTLRELDRLGQKDIADAKELSPMASEAKPLERAAKNLSEINAKMRMVRRGDATPAEKRRRLDELTVERNALLKATVRDAQRAQQGGE